VSGAATKLHVVEFEHPVHGSARVFWRWQLAGASWAWVPVAVEYDLFTPVSEQEVLTAGLLRARVDRSLSVSALEAEAEGAPCLQDNGLPWEPSSHQE